MFKKPFLQENTHHAAHSRQWARVVDTRYGRMSSEISRTVLSFRMLAHPSYHGLRALCLPRLFLSWLHGLLHRSWKHTHTHRSPTWRTTAFGNHHLDRKFLLGRVLLLLLLLLRIYGWPGPIPRNESSLQRIAQLTKYTHHDDPEFFRFQACMEHIDRLTGTSLRLPSFLDTAEHDITQSSSVRARMNLTEGGAVSGAWCSRKLLGIFYDSQSVKASARG